MGPSYRACKMPARAVTSSPYRYKEDGSPVWQTTSSLGTGVGEAVGGAAVPGPTVDEGLASGDGAAVGGVPVTEGGGLGCGEQEERQRERERQRKRETAGRRLSKATTVESQRTIGNLARQGRVGSSP